MTEEIEKSRKELNDLFNGAGIKEPTIEERIQAIREEAEYKIKQLTEKEKE